MAKEPQRPGFAAYGGANAFDPPLGKPLAEKKATHGIGTAVISDKRTAKQKKPLSPVIDKRSAKQKMRDAQTRRNS